jgi:hypothetical protein
MKKLLLILLCLPMIGFGQGWRYSSQGNDFDGNYKISSVVGTGNDYPYNSPKLVICYTEKSNEIDFYITDAGYYTASSNTQVMLSFNNEKGIIYKSLSLGYSSDRKSVYLDGNFSPNYLRPIKIFQKLMEASYVNIRIKNDYGQNDMRFSLSGSTKAIKYVIPYEDMLARDLEIEENKLAAIRAKEAILHYRDSVLNNYLNNYSLSEQMINNTIKEINKKIENYGYVINDIDSLIVWKTYLAVAKQYYLSARIFYKTYYEQEFHNLFILDENYVDSIPFAVGLIEADEIKEIVKEGLNEKPKRKDYKSSSDYMKALRKYRKSNKDNK